MSTEEPNFFEAGKMTEPMLELAELATLDQELEYLGIHDEVEVLRSEVVISGGGVTSNFDINLSTATATINPDKSYDVFAGDSNWDDQQSKPLHSAASIHAARLVKLNQALNAIADPQLIE